MRSSAARIVQLDTSRMRPPATDTHPVLICLLGPFRLLTHGTPCAGGLGGKTEALLAHLALHRDRRIPRDTLLSHIWPDHDLTLAGQSLNSLVYGLRKRLGGALGGEPPVLAQDGLYWLNTEAGIGVDLAVFDTLAQSGDDQWRQGLTTTAVASYRRAVDLYRGDLAAGADLPMVVERERLRVRYLTLLARLADTHFSLGEYDPCLSLAWRLLGHDPCREDAHRLVMLCYTRLGERAHALHQYRLCADILHAEFDAAPEAATLALFDQIRLSPERV